MKKVYAFLVGFLCMAGYVQATAYIWVGPLNGNWSDPMNWSLTGNAGGAGVPGAGDAVYFTPFTSKGAFEYAINLDVSPTISTISLQNDIRITLYTSVNTTLTVTSRLIMGSGIIKDSTVEDVKFDLLLDHVSVEFDTTRTRNWIFAGRVPVSSGNGAGLTIGTGSSLAVPSKTTLTFTQNSASLNSTSSNLRFNPGSAYVSDNKPDVAIPAAVWLPPLGAESLSPDPYIPAPIIQLNGDVRSVRHLANTQYGSIYLNLYALSQDVDLNLPDGTVLTQFLNILNTNNHTVTLLNAGSANSATLVIQGSRTQSLGGSFNLSGSTSKVALGHAPESAPGTSYKMDVRAFNQNGGNFSLQDANNYTGTSTLSIRGDFNETGGSFITNSTTTASPARLAVEFVGPYFVSAPSGPRFSGHALTVSSGSIDNDAHMVTLRVSDVRFSYVYVGTQYSPIGTYLSSSLQVGKLELNGGPILGSVTNVLTVANPGPDAIQVTNTNSFVRGPVKRMTNSTNPYTMPVGKGDSLNFSPGSCIIIPASATPSVYQAEYFNRRYTDTSVTTPFRGVDTSQYWNISKISGADAQVQLVLPKAVPSAMATDNLIVAHYTGGKWISEQGTVLSPGNAATGSVTSKVLSAFSPFTFGYGAFIDAPLAVHLISFDGHQENGGTMLNWKTASVASRFEVLRATDGINFSSIGAIPALSMQQQYTFFDNKPQPGKNFYRLRSVEKDGAVSLSDVIMINSAGSITELLTLAPTVVTGNASLRISALKDGTMELMVTDMAGRSWKKLSLLIRAGSSSNTLNLSDLPAGTYQISGYMNGTKTAAVRFIKR